MKQMATSDNWESKNSNNMLRTLTRAANYGIAYKSTVNKIHPTLYTVLRSNIHTTPVAAYKQKLLKQPVPELHETLEKYLTSVMPLLTCDELQKTKCLVDEFGKKGGCGEKLQGLLKQRAECMENWLEEWWLKAAYLGDRMSIIIHCSPGLAFPLQKFCDVDSRVDYTARLIISAMQYKDIIDNDKIPVEKQGKDELDMGQYKKFFGTCRIPKPKVDGLEFNPKSRHIVVASNNHFFKLYPVDECNKILSLKQISCMLKEILDKTCERAPAVGILSSDQRDSWATNFKLLTKDCENKKAAREIQKSLFLVCLDQPMSDCNSPNRLTLAGHQFVHGGGSKQNSGNRWFDKTVQFVIGTDGIVGMTYEHSPSEGQPIAMMLDYIVKEMGKVNACGEEGKATCVKELEFNVDCDLERAIKCAGQNMDCMISDFDLYMNDFKDYGKNFVKSQKMSPDSFFQMAMQLSYYRMYCKPAAHYESAAVRKFKGGRTDTIRSCSMESVKFAEGMLDDCKSPMDKRHLLEAAVASHKKYTTMAVNGLGVDRHFLGLQLIAAENNIELPCIFKDKGFIKSKHFLITSSQVSPKCEGVMMYGAVQPDGYAICYNPRDENMLWGVGCFNKDKTTNAKKMSQALVQSFKDMKDVLIKSQKAKL